MIRSLVGLILVSAILSDPGHAYTELETSHDPWLRENAFIGYDGCVPVARGRTLEPGERVLVFEAGKPAGSVEVIHRIAGEHARRMFQERGYKTVYQDSALWDSIGCTRVFADESPEWIARLEGKHGLPLILRAMPRSALIAGGAGRAMSPAEAARAVDTIRSRLPAKFTSAGVLRAAYRFPSPGGHDITRLFLGKAFYRKGSPLTGAPASIDSIQICEAFLHKEQLLTTEEYSRISGEMERAETEPPELDTRNWHDVQSQTMGFFSLDDGATWRHLTVNVGFEGIYWTIWGLSAGSPILWDYYLYTAH